MTEKSDCGNHSDDEEEGNGGGGCKAAAAILSLIVLSLLTILIVWAVLQPTKPKFILQDATLYAFNATRQPSLLSTSLQVTLSTHNPNKRIGVYYSRLRASASYINQQITLPTLLPQTYQGHKANVLWSPLLYGDSVPVAPFVASSLAADLAQGLVPITINIDGIVKWKVGTWVSGKYHLLVSCPAYIGFGSRSNGLLVGSAIKYQISTNCHVNV